MNLNLHGKNALVGGSSKGIGKAIAMELAALGANVTLVSRSPELMTTIKPRGSAPQGFGFALRKEYPHYGQQHRRPSFRAFARCPPGSV